jgi:hypothetical protein
MDGENLGHLVFAVFAWLCVVGTAGIASDYPAIGKVVKVSRPMDTRLPAILNDCQALGSGASRGILVFPKARRLILANLLSVGLLVCFQTSSINLGHVD